MTNVFQINVCLVNESWICACYIYLITTIVTIATKVTTDLEAMFHGSAQYLQNEYEIQAWI